MFWKNRNNPAKNSKPKQRKVVSEYVRLCGYKNGEIGNGCEKDSQNGNAKLSLEEIAKQLGTSKTNLKRVLTIERNLTDSMKELHAKAAEIRENFLAKAECGKE